MNKLTPESAEAYLDEPAVRGGLVYSIDYVTGDVTIRVTRGDRPIPFDVGEAVVIVQTVTPRESVDAVQPWRMMRHRAQNP